MRVFKQLRPVNSIGEGWLLVLQEIMDTGVERLYSDILTNDAPVKEVFGLTLTIQQPQLDDPIIQKYGDADEIAWMTDNFSRPGNVPALNDEHSYASRLYHYMGEKDQIAWLVQRLKENETIRSATITMLEPLLDQTYIPCVSLLDLQVIDHRLHLIAYCRALDFGKKAYVNMMMLAEIQKHVAEETNCPLGTLTLVMKSAHVYETEYERVLSMIAGKNLM